MGVSMNGGTPKWDVFSNGKSHLEMDDLVPPYYNSICRGPPTMGEYDRNLIYIYIHIHIQIYIYIHIDVYTHWGSNSVH